MDRNSKILIFITIIGVSTFITLSIIFSKDDKEDSVAVDTASSSLETSTNSTTPPSDVPQSELGQVYSASVKYRVPEGHRNDIDVSMTIDTAGKVLEVNVNNNVTNSESDFYVSNFESEISSKVVGKNINNISVSRVGGASLTTTAFMDAIDQVRTDVSASK